MYLPLELFRLRIAEVQIREKRFSPFPAAKYRFISTGTHETARSNPSRPPFGKGGSRLVRLWSTCPPQEEGFSSVATIAMVSPQKTSSLKRSRQPAQTVAMRRKRSSRSSTSIMRTSSSATANFQARTSGRSTKKELGKDAWDSLMRYFGMKAGNRS